MKGRAGAVIEKVVTSSQGRADQAGLHAARAAGIAIGGFAPKGWATEAGAAPWLAEFGLVECEMGRE
jgi:Circularly permutated YpsA SLOG family